MAPTISLERRRLITRPARALRVPSDGQLAAVSVPAVRDDDGTLAAAASMARTARDARQRFVEDGYAAACAE
ncbi:MAG: hypothetical protein ACT4P7_22870 [Gemmatimonadaceae bacterium]